MKYGILLYKDIEPIDVGATFGVLSMARRIAPEIEAIGVAREAGQIDCANGLRVIADRSFAEASDIDVLIVTGGPGWVQAAADPQTLDFVSKFVNKAPSRVASLCTGAMILEAAGVLDGRTVATKSRVFKGEQIPLVGLKSKGIDCIDASLVWSEGVMTSGGVTLGIDAMFALLETHHGPDVAAEVARVMEYDRALAANKRVKGYVTASAGHTAYGRAFANLSF